MQLVTIIKEFQIADADLKRARLEAAGFHPFVNNVAVASYSGTAMATGGILLQVPEPEAADAREFLNAPDLPTE